MRIFKYLVIVVILLSCKQESNPLAINDVDAVLKTTTVVVDVKEAVNKTMEQWHAAAAASDFDGYFGMMTQDGRWLGTDATENWDRAGIMEYGKAPFEAGRGWAFKTIERNIYHTTEDIAWFDELLDTAMGVCRGSGTLVKQDGDWKIAHYVFSMTIPNDDVPAIIQMKKEFDINLIQNATN